MAAVLMLTNEIGVSLDRETAGLLEAAARAAIEVGGGGRPGRWRVDLTLVSDERLRELSREYLGADHYTDVMSFSQLEETGDGPAPAVRGGPRVRLLGDVVISADRAREQAAAHDHGLADELALLVVHGVLHLLGHGDESVEEATAMRRLEAAALDRAGTESPQAPEAGPRGNE